MGSAGNVVLAVQHRANVLVQSMQTFYKVVEKKKVQQAVHEVFPSHCIINDERDSPGWK